MSSLVSFPNLLCLMLTGVLVVHLASRDVREGSLGDSVDRLEELYCRLPQSRGLEDSSKCSSAQKLFLLLGNRCSMELNRKNSEKGTINETNVGEIEEGAQDSAEQHEEDTVEEVEEVEEELPQEQPEEEEVKSSLVDSFIISLLVCSAIVSLLEWYRERNKDKRQVPAGVGGLPTVGPGDGHSDRRISLADLTVNRHIRRGESQQLDIIRQNSVSSGSKPPLLRRSSFPAQIPEGRPRHAPQRQQSTPATPVGRRLSVDLGEDDGSPDRRRVRIIRRH